MAEARGAELAGTADSDASEPRAAARRRGRAEGSGLALALAPLCVALALRALAIEPFHVTSESMLPTLQAGDHVLVHKLAYGARVPFTPWRLPALRAPARGDVVVFERTGADGARERLVKRVVALPGERVAQHDGRLWVEGAPVAAWPAHTLRLDAAGRTLEGRREQLGVLEHALVDDVVARGEDFELVVPEAHYFVLGDNRDHSADSRRFGAVPREALVGSVALLYWSDQADRRGDAWRLVGRGLRFERALVETE